MNYSKQIKQGQYDVVIIGAGMAGLSCGANLAAEGLSVLVLEQHFIPGGATTMFQRGDFIFEGGGHRVAGIRTPGAPLYELLKKINKASEIKSVPINPSYVVKIGEKTLEADNNIEKYKQNLITLFPEQNANIERYIADMLKINNTLKYLSSGKVNPLVLMAKHRLFLKYSKSTLEEFIKDYFTDAEIIAFVTAVGIYTTLPISRQSFLNFANMWGAHHLGEGMSLIEGGTKVLVDALVQYIEDHNGQVVVSKDVSRIIIENGSAAGVETKDGSIIKAKAVVSTASNEETYFRLVGEKYLSPSLISRIKGEEQCGALFQLFLGIKELDGKGLENVTTFVLGTTFDDAYLKRINDWDLNAMINGGVITVEGRENSPEGMRSVNISFLCPYAHPENWYLNGTDKKDYNAFKDYLAGMLIKSMSQHIPELENRIIIKNTATPLTMYRYTRATKGGLQGLAHNMSQSGKNRGSLKSPIANLYRAGQYVFPGAGIVTVTVSGILCAELVLKEIG